MSLDANALRERVTAVTSTMPLWALACALPYVSAVNGDAVMTKCSCTSARIIVILVGR